MTKKVIAYKVMGFLGEHTAGPYEESDVDAQREDICGYGGVYDLHVIEVTVHLLVAGMPRCGFSDNVPARWAKHHQWLGESDIAEVTCKPCLREHQELKRS